MWCTYGVEVLHTTHIHATTSTTTLHPLPLSCTHVQSNHIQPHPTTPTPTPTPCNVDFNFCDTASTDTAPCPPPAAAAVFGGGAKVGTGVSRWYALRGSCFFTKVKYMVQNRSSVMRLCGKCMLEWCFAACGLLFCVHIEGGVHMEYETTCTCMMTHTHKLTYTQSNYMHTVDTTQIGAHLFLSLFVQ